MIGKQEDMIKELKAQEEEEAILLHLLSGLIHQSGRREEERD